jgi:hypothetical protein
LLAGDARALQQFLGEAFAQSPGRLAARENYNSSSAQPAVPGNLPLDVREQARNPDGSVSTVRTISIGTDKGEVLIPTVVNGRVVSDDAAIRHYEQTGENFGTFRTPAEATRYAEWLHRRHERQISPR